MSKLCSYCNVEKAAIKRPKTGDFICKECFYRQFEDEIHETIISNNLFKRGENIAIAASGGKGNFILNDFFDYVHKMNIIIINFSK